LQYAIEFRPSARRDFVRLPKDVIERIDGALLALRPNPRPAGSTKMAGYQNRYRIRVGDYRIVYEIHDKLLVVLVVRIGHRRDVYRQR